MPKTHVSTIVNGDPVEFLCEPGETLLDCLRNELDMTGTKEGCGSGLRSLFSDAEWPTGLLLPGTWC